MFAVRAVFSGCAVQVRGVSLIGLTVPRPFFSKNEGESAAFKFCWEIFRVSFLVGSAGHGRDVRAIIQEREETMAGLPKYAQGHNGPVVEASCRKCACDRIHGLVRKTTPVVDANEKYAAFEAAVCLMCKERNTFNYSWRSV